MTANRRPLPPLLRRPSDRATAHIPALAAGPAGEMHGLHPASRITIHVVRDVYVWGAVLEGLSAARRLPYSAGVRADVPANPRTHARFPCRPAARPNRKHGTARREARQNRCRGASGAICARAPRRSWRSDRARPVSWDASRPTCSPARAAGRTAACRRPPAGAPGRSSVCLGAAGR
jgi:hypothetical protein